MTVRMLPALAALLSTAALAASPPPRVVVGSKAFTESVILGDIAADLARGAGARVVERRQLGGTRVLWDALRHGDIDVYAEYTGTLADEIFSGRQAGGSGGSLAAMAAADGIVVGPPLGFADSYALGMRASEARRLKVESIGDLRRFPNLKFGFSNEFMARADGWPGLQKAYDLPQRQVRGLAHELAYRAIGSRAIDVTDVYTTDPNVRVYRLRLLRDDRAFFPSYRAVYLWRADLARRAPGVVAALRRFSGRIDVAAMRRMNADVQLGGKDDRDVAAAFVGITRQPAPIDGPWRRIALRARQHLVLVAVSLAAAILLAVPLGVLAARRRMLGQVVLAVAGILQTMPSLALLVLMIPLLGIGSPPALVALFLYSLLPIVRNTHAGLVNIDPALIDSARVLGLTDLARLRLVELPLALPSILAGIKTSAVINVGTATLAALIGAGGLGQPILTGIRLNSMSLILQGAIPAVLLALGVQGAFELLERGLVPRGLRHRAR